MRGLLLMVSLIFFTSLANALTCVDQTNAGYSIDFKNGVLQASQIDSESTEYPIVQYTILKKKVEEAEDSPEIEKNQVKSKTTRILKVQYRAPKFSLTVDYSRKVKWKQVASNGNSTTMIDAKELAFPAAAVIRGKSLTFYCKD